MTFQYESSKKENVKIHSIIIKELEINFKLSLLKNLLKIFEFIKKPNHLTFRFFKI